MVIAPAKLPAYPVPDIVTEVDPGPLTNVGFYLFEP